jgi:hypothetical protein
MLSLALLVMFLDWLFSLWCNWNKFPKIEVYKILFGAHISRKLLLFIKPKIWHTLLKATLPWCYFTFQQLYILTFGVLLTFVSVFENWNVVPLQLEFGNFVITLIDGFWLLFGIFKLFFKLCSPLIFGKECFSLFIFGFFLMSKHSTSCCYLKTKYVCACNDNCTQGCGKTTL